MKKFLLLASGIIFLMGVSGIASAQVTPTGYTLSDIYYYLTDNTEATWGVHSLEPPSGATPGDTRFFTLSDIYGAALGHGSGMGFPVTGQTTSYRTGDNGTYQIGSAFSYQTSDPAVNGNIVTTDNVTGLMWASDGNATGCNFGAQTDWVSAIDWAQNLSFAGYSDWRIPNIKQLYAICVLDAGIGSPYIDNTYFPDTDTGNYWSSTSLPTDTTLLALFVSFDVAVAYAANKTSNYYVRAVRGGE